MPALGLTDHGALYGAIDFYTLCRDAGIKPIIGVETYIARNNRFDRDPRSEGHGKPWHLVLLAKDFNSQFRAALGERMMIRPFIADPM